ncbi:MAG TPA: SDR family oxidoreductase [Gemmatimonadales bacterium]|nr:SDR family oxidoreductase [Gemmatimonadales bacterium]
MRREPPRVLIVGATSAIATETARVYAAYGARLFLTGRDAARLDGVAADLRVRGARAVETAVLDVTDRRRGAEVIEAAWTAFGGLDLALLAHGVLPDQARCQSSAEDALAAIDVNFTSAIALLTPLANRFETARAGCIAVISSVAGDRGRQSNYVYGCAKGGLDRFLEGLRNRLFRSGVAVVTLKPGFVDTPMTAGMRQGPLFASARRAGRAVYRAIERRRDVAYIPWFWRPIMAIIRALPEPVFKRLRL